MSPPNPISPSVKPAKNVGSENIEKLNQINYSIQNNIKELEISEGQLSSVIK